MVVVETIGTIRTMLFFTVSESLVMSITHESHILDKSGR